MKYEVNSVYEYIEILENDRKEVINKLRELIKTNVTDIEEVYLYGMIGYVIPFSVYPKGYHTDNKTPLPYLGIASQKNYISLYHLGIYAFEEVLNWFIKEYPKHAKTKLDMGKGCIRFKKTDDIPYDLIRELLLRVSTKDFIKKYEDELNKK